MVRMACVWHLRSPPCDSEHSSNHRIVLHVHGGCGQVWERRLLPLLTARPRQIIMWPAPSSMTCALLTQMTLAIGKKGAPTAASQPLVPADRTWWRSLVRPREWLQGGPLTLDTGARAPGRAYDARSQQQAAALELPPHWIATHAITVQSSSAGAPGIARYNRAEFQTWYQVLYDSRTHVSPLAP